MDDRRDPQSRVLDEVALDLVSELGHPPGLSTRFNGDPADLADPVCSRQRQPVQREVAINEQSREPHATELRALLLNGHPRHQLINVCHKIPFGRDGVAVTFLGR